MGKSSIGEYEKSLDEWQKETGPNKNRCFLEQTKQRQFKRELRLAMESRRVKEEVWRPWEEKHQ